MSDYRRLISYIYEYEGKTKGKNVGFVKLEARNGQCRLNVNIKRMYVGGNAIGVYLLGRESQKTFLGNMFVRNGNGEFRATVDASNVEGSGVGLDTYYGLTVHDVKNSWRSYTTMWEDPAIAEAEMSEPVKSDASTGPIAQDVLPGTESDKPVQMEEFSNVIREIEEELNMEETHAAELAVGNGAEGENFTEETAPADVAPEEAEQMETGTVEADAVETTSKAAELVTGDLEQNVEKNAPAVDSEQTAEKNAPADSADSVTVTNNELPIVSPELENPDVLRYLQETESGPRSPEELWQELRKQYPKITPFDYDGGCEVLTIRPEDIGRLPRENWIYGNNSFLLHGYYNFRYLILVCLNNADGAPRYLIGVPGHYYSNEKYMATMFGFPNFVLSKKQPPNDGRFGYWYTDIKMR